jgi:hypothetical protein
VYRRRLKPDSERPAGDTQPHFQSAPGPPSAQRRSAARRASRRPQGGVRSHDTHAGGSWRRAVVSRPGPASGADGAGRRVLPRLLALPSSDMRKACNTRGRSAHETPFSLVLLVPSPFSVIQGEYEMPISLVLLVPSRFRVIQPTSSGSPSSLRGVTSDKARPLLFYAFCLSRRLQQPRCPLPPAL